MSSHEACEGAKDDALVLTAERCFSRTPLTVELFYHTANAFTRKDANKRHDLIAFLRNVYKHPGFTQKIVYKIVQMQLQPASASLLMYRYYQ